MKRPREKSAQQAIDAQQPQLRTRKAAVKVLQEMKKAASNTNRHSMRQLLAAYKETKHPILQTLEPQSEVYKSNPDKKKKPIELYLDTVNTLYKKKDLDLLISPLTVVSVFEKWSPRELAIFELALLRFGKQFEFISELIQTKTAKDVFEFYLQWKGTTHYKAYKANKANNNRSNYESIV